MKQAAGYRDVYENWIILQCGYDLQEGVMQLEVKDISELYEIWCFIKVKNMVQHILRNTATMIAKGSQMEGKFVKSLIQGSKSEVVFFENEHPEIQLASIMYNATTDDEEQLTDESVVNNNTDIAETTSKTTEQRPDIVLRLCKTDKAIQYTYLFDAKYRIRDTSIPHKDGVEVPPVGAINQMHRYRDAIYYTHSHDEKLKREVIGGYVLYPGNLNKSQFMDSYYQRSIDEVNIGAFPLKPGGHWKKMYDKEGQFYEEILDITSSEDVLYNQIKSWIIDSDAQQTLLDITIPQKSLEYVKEGTVTTKCIVINKEGINYENSGAKISDDPRFGVAIQPQIDEYGKRHNVLHLDEGLTTAAYLIITNKKECDVYYLKKGPILLEWKDVNGILTTKDNENLYVVFDIEGRAESFIPLIDMEVVVKEYGAGHEPKLLPFDKLLKH